MASGLLPKSPVSSSLCDEVPHIFIPKSHLEPREFLISSAKRLLQQYRHKADIRGTAIFCPLLEAKGCVKLIHPKNVEYKILQRGIRPYVHSIISFHDVHFLQNYPMCAASVGVFTRPRPIADIIAA
jgi:hypothetical protein